MANSMKSSYAFAGTCNYMPPECIQQEEISTLSDIWFEDFHIH